MLFNLVVHIRMKCWCAHDKVSGTSQYATYTSLWSP